MRLFYREDFGYDYNCLPLDSFEDQLYDELAKNPESRIILHGTKKSAIADRYCDEIMDFPGKGDCGESCIEYTPCNGKNGKCTHLLFGLIDDGEVYELSKNGLKRTHRRD